MPPIETIYGFFADHQLLIGIASVVLFFGTLAMIPVLVIYIPVDYFVGEHRPRERYRHPLIHAVLIVIKNSVGVILVCAGIIMLVLPGQGLITILIGLLALDLPGKYEIERKIVRRPAVHKALNAMRQKMGRPPLRIDGVE